MGHFSMWRGREKTGGARGGGWAGGMWGGAGRVVGRAGGGQHGLTGQRGGGAATWSAHGDRRGSRARGGGWWAWASRVGGWSRVRWRNMDGVCGRRSGLRWSVEWGEIERKALQMRHAAALMGRVREGAVCYGVVVKSMDPVLTEALSTVVDAVWIDTEHAPLCIESVQSLVMAAQLSGAATLVRLPSADPTAMKPVLDAGADGVIAPMVRSVADVERAVAGCRYPPAGTRGFGPRRASRFGHYGERYIDYANEHVIALVQIEHIEAVDAIDEILEVAGLSGIVIGANDLSFSMNLPGEPNHPDVHAVIERVLAKAAGRGKIVGMAMGADVDVEAASGWIERGVNWMVMESETSLMMRGAAEVFGAVRARDQGKGAGSGGWKA